MIYPKKNNIIHWFFHHYILRMMKVYFKGINYNRITTDKGGAVLLLANHFTWWDGFLFYYINHHLFKKKFHVMVIEETLQKVFFFKYMGAFSVSKNSRGMLASLDYAAGLLNNSANLVLIFPQGRLYSNFTDTVRFEKGLMRIIQKAQGNFQTVFAATFIENLQYKKPSANVYLKLSEGMSTDKTLPQLQDAYQKHYNSSKLVQTEIVI